MVRERKKWKGEGGGVKIMYQIHARASRGTEDEGKEKGGLLNQRGQIQQEGNKRGYK